MSQYMIIGPNYIDLHPIILSKLFDKLLLKNLIHLPTSVSCLPHQSMGGPPLSTNPHNNLCGTRMTQTFLTTPITIRVCICGQYEAQIIEGVVFFSADSILQCSSQAMLEYWLLHLRYCKHNSRYPLVSVDPGFILWRAFFPPLFFPSLFQLDFVLAWVSYHSFCFLPTLFPFFALFFLHPFLSSSNPFLTFPLPSNLFISPILFPFLYFLSLSFFSSPFCCFSFSLSSLYFILLISSSLSPPLSILFFCLFVFVAL